MVGLLAVLVALVCRRLLTIRTPPDEPKPSAPLVKAAPRDHLFTHDELRAHSGESATLYLSILGTVFDVSSGREFYGTGHAYSHFAGRDASKAFVTGSSEEGWTDDLSGFDDDKQFQGVVGWEEFYIKHEVYSKVGRLAGGAFYDAEGNPKPALAIAHERAALAKRAEVELQLLQGETPRCSSRVAEGSRSVWCEDEGLVPRELVVAGVRERCLCVTLAEYEANDKLVEITPACPKDFQRCTQPWPDPDRERENAL